MKKITERYPSISDACRVDEYQLLDSCFDELFPIMRSITGPGIEDSIEILTKHMPLTMEKVASGSKVFDWKVPPEWHFKRAVLRGPNDEIIADASINNLHVVNYSEPVNASFSLEELQPHLHSLESLPDAIPYVTSYYKRAWGFCLTHKVRKSLPQGKYQALIESEFKTGGVPFAHCVLPGECNKEILLSSYLCHPSLANNELSGPLVLLALYKRLSRWPNRRYRYRFLLNPETIGSLCFLSRYGAQLKRELFGGLILTCMGGTENLVRIKGSRLATGIFDNCGSYLANHNACRFENFSPCSGSDERQYCAPGFNLPVVQAAKTVYGDYDGYHNSLDCKEYMSISSLQDSVDQIERLLIMAEYGGEPVNQSPFGEPQLGTRNLYPNLNSANTWGCSDDTVFDGRTLLNRILGVLNLSDAKTNLFSIAQTLNCELEDLYSIIDRLEQEGLIKYGEELPTL